MKFLSKKIKFKVFVWVDEDTLATIVPALTNDLPYPFYHMCYLDIMTLGYYRDQTAVYNNDLEGGLHALLRKLQDQKL